MHELSSAKTVIRCRDYDASLHFYGSVLGLTVVDRWEEAGGRGCIFNVGGCGLIEVYEMNTADPRYDPSFSRPVPSDKLDLQLRTGSVDEWAGRLRGVWPFEGPEGLPWGQRWIKLRDPDNLLLAIYEGQL